MESMSAGGSFDLPEHLSVESWRDCVVSALTALECSQSQLVVGCSRLETFDPDGLVMLIGFSRYSERRQVRLVLANAPELLRETLEHRGFVRLFEWSPLPV